MFTLRYCGHLSNRMGNRSSRIQRGWSYSYFVGTRNYRGTAENYFRKKNIIKLSISGAIDCTV